LLNDASRYDFGDNWERVFMRMPQLLEKWRVDAQVYRQRVQQALMDVRRRDEEEWRSGGIPTTPTSKLYEDYHWAMQVGSLFVVDERTLSSTVPDAGTGLVVWFDDLEERYDPLGKSRLRRRVQWD
jgi:hypothetical protein